MIAVLLACAACSGVHALDERKSVGVDYRFIMMGAASALGEETVGDDSLLLYVRLSP